MRSESESSNKENNGRCDGSGDTSERSKLEWNIIRPEENKPVYLESIFGPMVYHINRLIGAEKKIFDRYTGKR